MHTKVLLCAYYNIKYYVVITVILISLLQNGEPFHLKKRRKKFAFFLNADVLLKNIHTSTKHGLVGSVIFLGIPSWLGFLNSEGFKVWSLTTQTLPSPDPTNNSSGFSITIEVTPVKTDLNFESME